VSEEEQVDRSHEERSIEMNSKWQQELQDSATKPNCELSDLDLAHVVAAGKKGGGGGGGAAAPRGQAHPVVVRQYVPIFIRVLPKPKKDEKKE
jgi:hypothetical protein